MSELRRSVTEATERIQQIIDAAERAADEIRADARVEADRYIEERRRDAERIAEEQIEALGDLSQRLRAYATQLKSDTDAVARSVEEAVARIGASLKRPQQAVPVVSPQVDPESESVRVESPQASTSPASPPAAEPPPAPASNDEGARLRATQMAVAGSSRDEIVLVLQEEFRIGDPEPIVDAILGSGH